MGEPFKADDVLAVDPFEGDYGGSGAGDATLSDRIVVARKDHRCHLCEGAAKAGTRTRARVEVYDGELMRFRWCEPCCEAMAASCRGDDEPYHIRQRIGDAVRRPSSQPGGG